MDSEISSGIIVDHWREFAAPGCCGAARPDLPEGAVWRGLIQRCLSSLEQIDRFTRPTATGRGPDTDGYTLLFPQDMPHGAPPNAGLTAPIACLCPAGILA